MLFLLKAVGKMWRVETRYSIVCVVVSVNILYQGSNTSIAEYESPHFAWRGLLRECAWLLLLVVVSCCYCCELL